jgi:methylated-DNA-[protein]-cysteine S-methyltransferase
LRRIAVGSTVSYGELARQLGREGSARAVASANASNPIAIVIPCHRVIGAAGSLTGYASGVERKRWLLEHEGALGQPQSSRAARLARAAPSAQARTVLAR